MWVGHWNARSLRGGGRNWLGAGVGGVGEWVRLRRFFEGGRGGAGVSWIECEMGGGEIWDSRESMCVCG